LLQFGLAFSIVSFVLLPGGVVGIICVRATNIMMMMIRPSNCYYYYIAITFLLLPVLISINNNNHRVNSFLCMKPTTSLSTFSSLSLLFSSSRHHHHHHHHRLVGEEKSFLHRRTNHQSPSSALTTLPTLFAMTVNTTSTVAIMLLPPPSMLYNKKQQQPESFSSAVVSSSQLEEEDYGNDNTVVLQPSTSSSSSSSSSTASTVRKLQPNKEEAAQQEEEEVVPTTMGEAWRVFFLGSYNGPRLVAVVIAVMSYWRVLLLLADAAAAATPAPAPLWSGVLLLLGNDGVIFVATILFWCLQEHFLHDKLLHCSEKWDWYGRQIHAAHHARPYHHVALDPAWLMLTWLGVAHVLLRFVLFPSSLSLALTATVAYASAGLWYEFLHYIVHTKVRFANKDSYLRHMKDHHARHHLVDHRYWLGFSLPAVDDLFGTNPTLLQVRQWKKEEKNRETLKHKMSE
jgi:Fatty acid hydroxylase superfamily